MDPAPAIANVRVDLEEAGTAEQRVSRLLGRLVRAVDDERQRISLDLHDTLGQHLSVLTLGLQALCGDLDVSPQMRARSADLLHAAQMMEDEVDRISQDLRPLALDDLCLDAALRRHVNAWSVESGIPVDLYTHGLDDGLLPAKIESTVYRVVQESLTNVRKHARARRVSVIAECHGRALRVIIEDDGTGFSLPEINPSGRAGKQLGLKGMRERVALVGGQLDIESTPHGGTTIYLNLSTGPISSSIKTYQT